MLALIDILLFITHVVIIVFNLTGWIWKRTRRIHLWVIGITIFSWVGLGFKYGLGYCFLTDWHWDIKRELGETALPNSFVQYLFDLIGIMITPGTTDIITGLSFLSAIILAIYFNFIKKS